MKRPLGWRAASISSVAAGVIASLTVVGGGAPNATAAASKHVLLLSIDGLHASDLAVCEQQGLCPELKMLAGDGTTYSHAMTSEPSDSAPGLMALVTGGDPKLTGVYYDDSYSRDVYAPPAQTATLTQDCSGPAGFEAQYFENVDTEAPTAINPNGNRQIIGERVDPAQLAFVKQDGKCVPLAPNDFLRTNSIFSVAHAAGMYTAWADKHPVYNAEVAGHGTPNAVDDPFNTEINADVIPTTLVDTRGNVINFPLPTADGSHAITDSLGDTEAYDQIKVDAVLNEIDGHNSSATLAAPEPAIFGMNFQTVSVAQKLVDPTKCDWTSKLRPIPCVAGYTPGGYEPGSTSDQPIFTPQLMGAIQSVDSAIGSMVNELKSKGELASTTIIITAKHGQSPIDPTRLAKIGSAEQDILATAGITNDSSSSFIVDDDVALVWLSKPSQQQGLAQKGVEALVTSEQHGNPARIQTVLSGDVLKDQFGDPAKDPRTPDIVIQPIPGTIYSKSVKKVMEHGGFAPDDTHVAMLVVNGADVANNTALGNVVDGPVRTAQVAPTVLATLGLDPHQLDAVRVEHVQVLPTS